MDDGRVERLYAEHARDIFRFLAYRTGSRESAEDLLADTFERVIRGRATFVRGRGTEKAWLYGIALNALRDQIRRSEVERRAMTTVGASGDTASEPFDRVAARDEIARALDVLSDEEREAVALRYGADLTVPEIARVTKQPLASAEGRVYRGLRKLRAHLEEHDPQRA